MINRQLLLSDLQKQLKKLEADLLERSESADVPEVGKTLHAEYDRARENNRTAQNFEEWRTDAITQAAAAWVLSSVFVRFLEDNQLIDPPKISGLKDRLQRARDEYDLYFQKYPQQTDREYLLAIFDQLAKLPGTKDVFGDFNPIRDLPNWLSGDAAGELLRFFQKIDANSGSLVHDFTDPNWDTRFLGDLYQDLSEAARKKYALLQTPEFVEEFILDRTLEPALEEFKVAMGDPERTLECCSMLSICEQSRGDLDKAVEWLLQGILAPGFPPEDSVGLRYDLGELYLQQGHQALATNEFKKVYELDSDYRDVAARLE